MKSEFRSAVPEIPVTDMNAALDYYQNKLGFRCHALAAWSLALVTTLIVFYDFSRDT